MNLILKYLTAIIIFLVFACESSGGVWLGEGNNSGIQFVVTGTDMDNSALTEIITGTKESKATGIKLFKTVTSIKAEGPTLGNITTGVLSGQDEGKEIKFTINRNFNSGKENVDQ